MPHIRPPHTRLLLLAALLLIPLLVRPLATTAHAAATPGPTAGCGRAWTPGTTVSGTLAYGGLQRTYLLHIPLGYVPTTPTMLVFNLHGMGMSAVDEAWLTHMSSTADAQHFLVVYPQGTTGSTTTTGWDIEPPNWPGAATNPYSTVDDAGFLSALVTSLEGQVCVDTTRIDATGFSLGGVMSYDLACSNLSWLAAIAVVAATLPRPVSLCTMAHPTPLLAVHGQLDPASWYTGMGLFNPSIPTIVATWAQAVGCPGTTQTGFAQGDVVETVYTSCPSGSDAALYTVTDGGHTWPGGYPTFIGKTTTVIDASSLIAAFFAAHPLH